MVRSGLWTSIYRPSPHKLRSTRVPTKPSTLYESMLLLQVTLVPSATGWLQFQAKLRPLIFRRVNHTETKIQTMERWLCGCSFRPPTWQLTYVSPVLAELTPSYRHTCNTHESFLIKILIKIILENKGMSKGLHLLIKFTTLNTSREGSKIAYSPHIWSPVFKILKTASP